MEEGWQKRRVALREAISFAATILTVKFGIKLVKWFENLAKVSISFTAYELCPSSADNHFTSYKNSLEKTS